MMKTEREEATMNGMEWNGGLTCGVEEAAVFAH